MISEAVVVTAAHCVWNIKKNLLKLTMGSISSHLNDSGNMYTKTFGVKRIIVHPLYQDKYDCCLLCTNKFQNQWTCNRFGSYGSDIALIEIDGNVDLNSYFLPVCIDWNLDDITSHLTHTNLGYVAGMGVSEDNLFSDRLKVTTLPVVADEKCMEKQQPDFRKYLTFTTFCAGWENGTGVCNGMFLETIIFSNELYCIVRHVEISIW